MWVYALGIGTLLIQRYGDLARWKWRAKRSQASTTNFSLLSLLHINTNTDQSKVGAQDTDYNANTSQLPETDTSEKIEKANELVLFSFPRNYKDSNSWDCIKVHRTHLSPHFQWYISHCFAIHHKTIWVLVLLVGVTVHVQQPDLFSVLYLIALGWVAWAEKVFEYELKLTQKLPHIFIMIYGFFSVLFILVEYCFAPQLRLPPYPFGGKK